MKRANFTSVMLACVVAIGALAGAAPAHAADSSAPPSLQDQLQHVDTSSVVDSKANEMRAIRISENLLGADDPAHYFADLTEADQAVFVAYSMQAKEAESVDYHPVDATARASEAAGITPNREFSTLATGCWVGSTSRTGKNVFGNDLWRLYLSAGWCASNSTVTSAYRASSTGETYWIGWVHQGRIGGQSGVVSNQGRTWVQHRFTYGIGGWDAQTQDPCLRIRGTGSGTVSADLVCSLY